MLAEGAESKRVRTAVLIYLLCFIFLNVSVWTWFVIHRHGVHYFPLGERKERFGDLLRFTGKYQVWKDARQEDSEHLLGTLFPRNYPPLSIVIYLFLLQVCAPYAMPVLATLVLGGIAVACAGLWTAAKKSSAYSWYMGLAIFATGLFGWGTEQVIMRGNIEGLMWIAVCMGAALYMRRRYTGAAAAFGVACCIKPHPVLWLALMARHRKYKAVCVGLLTTGLVTLASLLVLDPNPIRAYRNTTAKSNFFEVYTVAFRPMDEMKGDHSLLQTMKTLARVVRNHGLNFSYQEYRMHPSDPLAIKLYHIYLVIAVIGGLLILWKAWNMPTLNQIFALACVTTVLPMVAGEYTLTILLIPMGFFLLFMLEDVAGGRVKFTLANMLWILLPCAWIMATEQLWLLHGVYECIAILVLLGASLTIPMPSMRFAEAAVPARSAIAA